MTNANNEMKLVQPIMNNNVTSMKDLAQYIYNACGKEDKGKIKVTYNGRESEVTFEITQLTVEVEEEWCRGQLISPAGDVPIDAYSIDAFSEDDDELSDNIDYAELSCEFTKIATGRDTIGDVEQYYINDAAQNFLRERPWGLTR